MKSMMRIWGGLTAGYKKLAKVTRQKCLTSARPSSAGSNQGNRKDISCLLSTISDE
jgi:hypothetical protein